MNDIEFKKVSSSHIEQVGYDKDKSMLYVIFTTQKDKTKCWAYSNVSESLYNDILVAKSPGSLFGTAIRAYPSKYPAKPIEIIGLKSEITSWSEEGTPHNSISEESAEKNTAMSRDIDVDKELEKKQVRDMQDSHLELLRNSFDKHIGIA